MRQFVTGGLALALAVYGGCASPNQVRIDPNVETVLPAPSVVYAPPATTAATTSAPAATAVITPGNTTVVDAPSTTSAVPAPDPGLVPAPAGTTVVPAPGTTVVPAPGTTTVVPPAGTTTVVAAPAVTPAPATVIQTLRADDIHSPRVRAQTIFANRIEANEIRGVIHQDKSLKVGNTNGAIKGNEIVATVIYADEIKADIVIADHIYVRDIRRR